MTSVFLVDTKSIMSKAAVLCVTL